jgi:hypothetical protein
MDELRLFRHLVLKGTDLQLVKILIRRRKKRQGTTS